MIENKANNVKGPLDESLSATGLLNDLETVQTEKINQPDVESKIPHQFLSPTDLLDSNGSLQLETTLKQYHSYDVLDENLSLIGLINTPHQFADKSTELSSDEQLPLIQNTQQPDTQHQLNSDEYSNIVSNYAQSLKILSNASVSTTLAPSDDSGKLSNISIAEWLTSHYNFINIDETLYVYDNQTGHYSTLSNLQKVDQFIRSSIPNDVKPLISNYTNREALQWLMSMKELRVHPEDLLQRKNLILFNDCVVNFQTNEILEFSPEFYFTSNVNAHYLYVNQSGNVFEDFLTTITQNNDQIYMRIQELFGYVISNIRNIKVIPYLIGPKDSGKSIILKLLTQLIGESFTSEIGMEEFNDERYLNQLVGKKLNVCAEIPEIPLKKLDIIKKLSGGDSLQVRSLYQDARKYHNEAALVFAGNDLPNIKRGQDRSNAFYDRLLLIPLQHQVPKKDQDIHLLEKLLLEVDYIAKWAVAGLQRLVQNNYCFTELTKGNELIEQYINKSSGVSISNFVTTHCSFEPRLNTFTTDLYEAYEYYCFRSNQVPESSRAFHATLLNQYKVQHKRLRSETENRRAYIGVGLRDEDQDVVLSQFKKMNNDQLEENKLVYDTTTPKEQEETHSSARPYEELLQKMQNKLNK